MPICKHGMLYYIIISMTYTVHTDCYLGSAYTNINISEVDVHTSTSLIMSNVCTGHAEKRKIWTVQWFYIWTADPHRSRQLDKLIFLASKSLLSYLGQLKRTPLPPSPLEWFSGTVPSCVSVRCRYKSASDQSHVGNSNLLISLSHSMGKETQFNGILFFQS